MNTKDLSGIAVESRMTLLNTASQADHNFNWDQKKVTDRESKLIPRNIKETIPSLKNPNHINKIFLEESLSHEKNFHHVS